MDKTLPPSASMEFIPITSDTVPSKASKLSETDMLILSLEKQKKQIAILQMQNAELIYRNFICQIYIKYGLKESDAISENGEIIIGAK
jgi:hypothetical protein